MKIYRSKSLKEHKHLIPTDHAEKISLLRLVAVGEYLTGVGTRDDDFFLICEDENDDMYLQFMSIQMRTLSTKPKAFAVKFTKQQVEKMCDIDNYIREVTNDEQNIVGWFRLRMNQTPFKKFLVPQFGERS
jgi:hypothetical protein|tara:strand:+ start:4209 stop:4601 length:393 start_codon:yes stop_codon:yes gene_type:complete